MLQVLSALCLLLPVAFGNNLDSAGQKTCLTEHNNYRAELAKGNVVAASGKLPAAANMNELTYGHDLEAKAQAWAANCPGMQHTPNIDYGQNLYWTSQSVDHSTALKEATKAWWNEVKMYRGDVVLTMSIFNQGVGHFTQMAQAKATQVGCAVQSCRGTYVVCNYNHQNMLNQPIYEKGSTCKSCKTCSNSLCKDGSSSSSSSNGSSRGGSRGSSRGGSRGNSGGKGRHPGSKRHQRHMSHFF